MNKLGKQKHVGYLRIFERGATPAEDVFLGQRVTRLARWRKDCRKIVAQFAGRGIYINVESWQFHQERVAFLRRFGKEAK